MHRTPAPRRLRVWALGAVALATLWALFHRFGPVYGLAWQADAFEDRYDRQLAASIAAAAGRCERGEGIVGPVNCDAAEIAAAARSPRTCGADPGVRPTSRAFRATQVKAKGECCALCERTLYCKYWTWDAETGSCELRKTTGLPWYTRGSTWTGFVGRRGSATVAALRQVFGLGVRDPGARDIAATECSADRVLRNVSLDGAQLGEGVTLQGPEPEAECCRRCAAAVGCIAWELLRSGACRLRAQLSHIVPAVAAAAAVGAGVLRRPGGGAPLPQQLDTSLRKITAEDISLLFAPEPPETQLLGFSPPAEVESPAWQTCPDRADVSFVMALRNDPCEDPADPVTCQAQRLQRALRSIAWFDWAGQGVVCEIIVVTWNENTAVPRTEQLAPPPQRRSCAVRYIAVPAALHLSRLGGDQADLSEHMAKNAGARRANGRWLIMTNPDILWPARLLRSIALDARERDSGAPLTLQAQRVSLDQWGGLAFYRPAGSPPQPESPLEQCQRETGRPYGEDDALDSVPGDPHQPSLMCSGCPGDFLMSPCEAWERGRGHAECAHTSLVDHELPCWFEHGDLNPLQQAYPRRSYVARLDPRGPFPASPAGCATYHQYHTRHWRRGQRETGRAKWRERFRPCFGADAKWWRTRTNADFNSTARPECWGACAAVLRETRFSPTRPAARRLWHRRQEGVPFPALPAELAGAMNARSEWVTP